jgi:hypothetical protein
VGHDFCTGKRKKDFPLREARVCKGTEELHAIEQEELTSTINEKMDIH